jgi:hypothetical protein
MRNTGLRALLDKEFAVLSACNDDEAHHLQEFFMRGMEFCDLSVHIDNCVVINKTWALLLVRAGMRCHIKPGSTLVPKQFAVL